MAEGTKIVGSPSKAMAHTKTVHIVQYDHHADYDSMTKETESDQLLGKDVLVRTAKLGSEAKFFRALNGFTSVNEEKQANFNKVVQNLGKYILKQTLTDQQEIENERLELQRRQQKVGRILRKRVEVVEHPDGEVSIALDRNWDTSSWSNDMIESSCEFLINMFSNPASEIPEAVRSRAALMLQKLLNRHQVGADYVRRNLEALIAKATNRSLRGGRTAGVLDMLYVINYTQELYTTELSRFSFVQKVLMMMMLEMRLAAIIIQHMFRSYIDRRKVRYYAPYTEGFGDPKEIQVMREYAIKIRALELRAKWTSMHQMMPQNERTMCGGQRGPAFMAGGFVLVALKIVLYLVSPESKELAIPNREDVLNSDGMILLSSFLAFPASPFADIAINIFLYVVNVGDCLGHILHSGTIRSVCKYYRNVRRVVTPMFKEAKKPMNVVEERKFHKEFDYWKQRVINISLFISRLATHAAGLFRARNNYRFVRAKNIADAEDINYKTVLVGIKDKVKPEDVLRLLGDERLVLEIMDTICTSSHLNTIRGMLNALYALSCSECHSAVLTGFVANGARTMLRVLSFIEEQDAQINSLSLSVFLQLNTLAKGRNQLFRVNIVKYLQPWLISHCKYDRKPYIRAMLIAASLCRGEDWRAYDPVTTYHDFKDSVFTRRAVLVDFLRTIKCPSNAHKAEMYSIADLSVLPNDSKESSIKLAQVCKSVGILHVTNFLTHPDNEKYFQSLPWDESVGSCVILEALSTDYEAAKGMFSDGTTLFLCYCILLAKFMFTGPAIAENKMVLILNGVISACNAIGNLCDTGIGDEVNARYIIDDVRKCDLISSICYFINTLSIKHPKLDEEMQAMQRKVGAASLFFLKHYSKMLIVLDPSNGNTEIHYLRPCGTAVVNLMYTLRSVHGKTPEMTELLDEICKKLCNLTIPSAIALESILHWNLVDSLKVHMPSALCAYNACSVHDDLYIDELGVLPASYFELLSNVGHVEAGKKFIISDGFLRRSIENVLFLYSTLEGGNELQSWTDLKKSNREAPTPSMQRQKVASCLRVIERCANYHSPQNGSANDIIYGYPLIEACIEISRPIECPLDDDALCAAIRVISVLSKDSVRIFPILQRLDMLGIIRQKLRRVEECPVSAVNDCINIVSFMAQGLRTDYLAEYLPLMRKQINKCGRIYPEVSGSVRNANWYITKCIEGVNRAIATRVMSREDTTKSNSDFDTMEFHEIIALKKKQQEQQQDPSYHSSNYNSDDGDADGHRWGGVGTHEVCGVSSCGSLRHTHGDSGHGTFADMSEADINQSLMALSVAEDGLCELSQLSAREEALKDRLHAVKSYNGFVYPKTKPRGAGANTSSHQLVLPKVPLSSHPASKAIAMATAKKEQYAARSPIKAVSIDDIPELILTKPPLSIAAALKRKQSKIGLF